MSTAEGTEPRRSKATSRQEALRLRKEAEAKAQAARDAKIAEAEQAKQAASATNWRAGVAAAIKILQRPIAPAIAASARGENRGRILTVVLDRAPNGQALGSVVYRQETDTATGTP